ncbi:MAG: hypothetical protein ABL994_23955, partial [Verrucomicrobiales bacterium]
MITEREISSEWLAAPCRAWIYPALTTIAADCFVFLDGDLYTDRVRAPEMIKEAQATESLPPMNCVYLPN